MLGLAVTKSDSPYRRKVPNKNKSSCAGVRPSQGRIAQGRYDLGFQAPFGNHQVAVQTVHHIHQRTLIGQLGLVDFAFDHNRTGWILYGHKAFALHTRGGQRDLIRAQCFTEQ